MGIARHRGVSALQLAAIALSPPDEDSDVKLRDYTAKIIILAHQENTDQLAQALSAEGFDCQVQRQPEQPEQSDFARSYRCLLNHRTAWQWVADNQQPAIIVEADFVPVRGLGQLPLPFDPEQTDVGMAWLYTCAAQIYHVSPLNHAQGFSSSLVAYLLIPRAVPPLQTLFERVSQTPGPRAYYPWDSEMDKTLLAAGLRNYVPFRNYGEHGSDSPNPEHQANRLGRTHRADVLYGSLAFAPAYSASEGFWQTRLKGRARGLARLLGGRYLRPAILRKAKTPPRLASFAIRRHFCWPI